ncbi:calcium-binding protein [Thiomicrospira sp. WB1]|uniref:beta strand repeat-containing protein n=1 Tax=Thiomicrospira sp. WB1 TaxID=1685380 RepID=UPI00074B1716|nr:calcium-binding protein [Thiomicrospira sp. WB1]KUJ72459.1 hypothetical protein AVO41_01210 [Thiomicrospira sp. WB1]
MAITAEQQTQIIKLASTMFDAAPGGYLQELKDIFESVGQDLNAFASVLEGTPAFQGEDFYPSSMTNEDAATKMAATYGLDTSTAAGEEAYNFFLSGLNAGTSKGALFVEANDYLANVGEDSDFANVAKTLDNKVAVAEYYSVEIDADNTDLTQLSKVTNNIDADTDVSTNEAISTLVDDNLNEIIVDGETFTLTTGTDDVLNGTAQSDLFDASTQNTLQSGDIILDNYSDDSDVLNASVTTATVDARLQNVENVNITGKYVTTGYDLTNTTGTNTLTLDTELGSGTATVTNANSLNATNIVADSNIATLNVTSLASGTRDTVYVDSGDASATNITGQAAGVDKYDITIAASNTLDLNTLASAGDTVGITTAGNFNLDDDGANTEAAVTITANTADTTVTLDTATQIAKSLTLAGSKDITVHVAAAAGNDSAALNGVAATSSTSGTSTFKFDTITDADDYAEAAVDVVEVAADLGGAVSFTVNENTTVDFTADATNTGAVTVDIDNADGDLTTGTLLANISDDLGTNALTTGAKVDTLLLEATPDEASDTDSDDNGTAETQITITDLTLNAATNTVVVQGSEDLEITTLTNAADDVLTASTMTGNLTIGEITEASTAVGGKGNDSITAATAGKAYKIYGGDGNDTIDLSGADTASKIYGEAGNDTLKASSAGDTIEGGAGDDTIVGGAGADTVKMGAGADSFEMGAGEDGDTVSDFVSGTDTIILTGAATGDLDLTSQTVTSGAYDFDGAGNFDITLTGSTATDLSGDVQLGTASANFTAHTGTTVAGSKDDVIAVNGASTITTGSGNDAIIVATSETTATVSDFTSGSDVVILTGAAAADEGADLSSVTPTSGKYDITTNHQITLENGGSALTGTDLSEMVQLGADGAAFTVAAATGAVTVTGGAFNDFITVTDDTSNATINFIDNGGTDTVEIAQGGNAASLLSFDGMTGITDTTGTDIAADAAKTADAQDGSVYVFADSSDGAGSSKISTFTEDAANGITSATILDDVAAFLEANLGEADGENYVAIINDAGTAGDAYAFLVNADADGIQADNITLIGNLTTTDNAVIDATNVA